MDITFVNSTGSQTTGTSKTYTNYDLSTSDILLVFCANYSSTTDVFTGVTCGGTAMTKIDAASGADTHDGVYLAVYYIAGQTGTKTIVISAGSSVSIESSVMTYSGVYSTYPVGGGMFNFRLSNVDDSPFSSSITNSSAYKCVAVSNCGTGGEELTTVSNLTVRQVGGGGNYYKAGDNLTLVNVGDTYTGIWDTTSHEFFASSVVLLVPAPMTNETRVSSSMTNTSKPTTSFVNVSRQSSSMTNQAKP